MAIGAAPPPLNKTAERITNPQIKGWMGKHAVLRFLSALQEIGIAEAFKITNLPPRTPKLIEIDQNVALLFTLSRQSFTDLVMTFPILNDRGEWNTNWPLLPSFPLFLRNIVYALGNVNDGAGEELLQPGQVVQSVPGAGLKVPIWILGSSLFGAQLAAMLSLPYAFASHFAPDALMPALQVYRERFQPSEQLERPYAMVGVNVIAAETDGEARRLFTSAQQQFTNMLGVAL